MKYAKINQRSKLLILDQVINKVLNVIIAISYTICNTVDTCWLVGQQTLMSYKKVFLFVR